MGQRWYLNWAEKESRVWILDVERAVQVEETGQQRLRSLDACAHVGTYSFPWASPLLTPVLARDASEMRRSRWP